MNYLLDTNILLRLAENNHTQHQIASDALQVLQDRDAELAVTPQVIYEYWVVVTRPENQNGLGMTATAAEISIENSLRFLSFLPDHSSIYRLWKQLVIQHQVLGKRAHDARLAATAIFYECDGIITFNDSDFRRYPQLTVLTPEQVLQP